MNSTHKRLVVSGLLLGLALAMGPAMAQNGQANADARSARRRAASEAVHASMKGRKLSATEAAALEQRLVAQPGDLVTRFMLIGYYGSRRSDPEFRKKRAEQTFWLIDNIPDSPQLARLVEPLTSQFDEGFEKAKNLWLKQLEAYPGNLQVVSNAAQFFLLSDRSVAEKLLKAGADAEPNEPEWHSRLGHLYLLELSSFNYPLRTAAPRPRQPDMVVSEPPRVQAADEFRNGKSRDDRSPQPELDRQSLARLGNEQPVQSRQQAGGRSRGELAVLAYEQFSLAYGLTVAVEEKGVLRIDLARSAFEAGKFDEARQLATVLVNQTERGWNYGNAIHHGHLILGRLALLAGNLDEAKHQLIAAGETPGSPSLNSFGPNMTLAKELLEKGERDSVLQYFELCAKFWVFKDRALPQWTAMVKGGGIPNFGANLDY